MSVEVDDNIKRQVKEIFQHMEKEVIVKLFVDKDKCLTCTQTKQILELLVELAPEGKLKLDIYNKEDNPPEINKYISNASIPNVNQPPILSFKRIGKRLRG